MNTNTHHCAGCRHDGDPPTPAQKAMVRIISLTLRPGTLAELSTLMDEHNEMTAAAYIPSCEPIDFAGAPLIEQFDRASSTRFENWDARARFIIEFVYRRGRWIGRREQKTGRPFADLLAIGDEIAKRHLRDEGLLVIDISDKIAVFHHSCQ